MMEIKQLEKVKMTQDLKKLKNSGTIFGTNYVVLIAPNVYAADMK